MVSIAPAADWNVQVWDYGPISGVPVARIVRDRQPIDNLPSLALQARRRTKAKCISVGHPVAMLFRQISMRIKKSRSQRRRRTIECRTRCCEKH